MADVQAIEHDTTHADAKRRKKCRHVFFILSFSQRKVTRLPTKRVGREIQLCRLWRERFSLPAALFPCTAVYRIMNMKQKAARSIGSRRLPEFCTA
jgi:hypothetical protein